MGQIFDRLGRLQSFWKVMNQKVTHATVCLAFLCFIDAAVTLYVVRMGFAKEANPLMDMFIAMGNVPFLVAKGLSFMIPLTILELLRHRRPKFINAALNVGVVGYLLVYVVGSILVN